MVNPMLTVQVLHSLGSTECIQDTPFETPRNETFQGDANKILIATFVMK